MLKLYDRVNNRLIFIKEKATPMFWDVHWEKHNLKFTNRNRFIRKYLNRYFDNKEELILEAGCGIADKVLYMHYNGYKVIGIDYAKNTIIRAKSAYPELKLIIGDIRRLPFKSGIYRCIWCLGVIEHFIDGFEDAIIELYRVLQNKGVLFLSFPTLSPIRKIKIKLSFYKPISYEYEKLFYQYAFDEDIVKRKLEEYGFRYIESSRYDGIKGLKDEISLLKYFLQKIYDSHNFALKISRIILNWILNPIASHMCLIVFKKI